MTKSHSLSVAVMLGFAAYFTQAYAQDNSGFHEAMSSCVADLGIARPAEGQRPSDEDRAKLDSCLQAKGFTKPEGSRGGRGGHGGVKNHEAFEACITELGLARPERGQRPSDEDRAKIKACVDSKASAP